MVDAVLAGDGLDDIAAVAAEATGGTVAIVLPAVGAAIAGVGAERRLDAVRRFVAARLSGQPGALPPGYVADAPVGAGGDKVGAVVLLDDGRPPAAGVEAVLRLAALASLALAAVSDAAGDGAAQPGPCSKTCAARRSRARPSSRAPVAWASTSRPERSPCAWPRARGSPRGPRPWSTTSPRAGSSCAAARSSMRCCPASAAPPRSARRPSPPAWRRSPPSPSPATNRRRRGCTRPCARPTSRSRSCARARPPPQTPRPAPGSCSSASRSADPAALRRLRDTSVGPALGHDADHGSDLAGTLRTYLAHGANMNATAAAIPSHRHTVAYRLERLRELTGLHPGRVDDRERLGLGVKAHLVLEALAEVR